MIVELLRQVWALSFGSRGNPWSFRRQLRYLRFRMETYGGKGVQMTPRELARYLRWAARERANWSRLD